jgi:hypothetical protein
MEPIVRTLLSELHEVAGDLGYVFVNPDRGTRYTEVKKSFASVGREASITDFSFTIYAIRSALRLADAGVDVVKIKN